MTNYADSIIVLEDFNLLCDSWKAFYDYSVINLIPNNFAKFLD